MNNRLKEIRKTLKKSQEEFGEMLGVTGASISRLEKGERNLTDQMLKSICREFNVEPLWLIEGIGEMFCESEDMEFIDRIMFGENEFHKNLFKILAKLDDSELKALESIIDKFASTKKTSEINH